MKKAKKFTIVTKCTKTHFSLTCNEGEVSVIAEVFSKGVAVFMADKLKSIYPAEYFKIKVI